MKRLLYIMTAVFMCCQVGWTQSNKCTHVHENDAVDQKITYEEASNLIKAEALKLVQPFYEETLARAIEMAKQNPEAYTNPPSTCFAPGTSQKRLDEFYAKRRAIEHSLGIPSPDDNSRFDLNARWTSTATDGGGLGQGDITTLTWSYVPDGTTISGNCDGEAAAPSNFIAFFNGVFGTPTTVGDFTTAPWHNIFVGNFNSWSSVTGLTFVYEPNDDGATAAGPGSSLGALGVRGDIRITGHSVDGNSGILACNYYPTSSGSGDMIIDTGDNYYSNNPGAGTTNVITHEVGHGLGLRHSCPISQTKLMEPFITTAFTGPQEDDILAVNRHYGDKDENNNNAAQATFLGANPLPATYMVSQNSIDDNADTDSYSVMVNQPAKLTATLQPTGTTYLAGSQNGDGSCQAGTNFDALRQADIMLEILDTDGVTLIGSSAAGGVGQQEMVFEVPLPAVGTYFVRVSQQGALIDVAQMYDLDVELVAACALDVSCALITDMDLTCRADLPPVDFDLPIIIDACGDVIRSALTIIPGNSGCPGDQIIITRTYFLQDDQGNMEQCMQTFTVESNNMPTITCPPGGTIMCATDLPPANVAAVVSTADCGMADISVTGPVQDGPDDCPATTFTYTYTATDFCGRMVSCDQVYIIANDPPTITCPANQLVACFADIVVDPANAVVTTSCTLGSNVTISGPVQVGVNNCTGTTYTYTYTVIDDCGRSAQCQQTFTIQSSFLSISCPAPEIVECAALIDADPEDATVTANCDVMPMTVVVLPPVIVGIPDCPGTTYTYTYQGFSPCFPGLMVSCQRVFTIANDPPQIICPPPATVECAADIIPDITLPNVFTSCTLGSTVTFVGPTLVSGIADCPGSTYSVVYTVEDDCGRTASCTQIYTIENDPPTIVCPADMVVECAVDIVPDITLPVVTTSCTLGFVVTFTGPTLVSGTPDCPGARYEVVYTVEDDCGRMASCTQTFIIQNAAPTIVCTPGFTVECVADIVIDPMADVTVTTSCMLGFNVSVTGPKIIGGLPDCPGTIYRYHYVVQDDCGRQALCTREFVIDNVGPAITTCPANQIVECEDEIAADREAVVFTTSCMLGATVTASDPVLSGGVPTCNAVYTITYTVTDACGRSTTCDQTFTIVNTGPVITVCAPDRVVECQFDIASEPELLEVDLRCGSYTIFPSNIMLVNNQPDHPSCPGTQYRIDYTVIDLCGRSDVCTQIWTVENDAPRVIAPDPITIACLDDLNLSMNNAQIEVSCGVQIVRQEIIGPIYNEDEPLCNGDVVNFLYSVWDACGRMTCEAQIITIDASGSNLGPQFDDMTVECDQLPPVETTAEACGVTIDLTVTESTLTLPGGDFRVFRDYVGIDACGETIDFRQVINVECSTSPPLSSKVLCTMDELGWKLGSDDLPFSNVKVSKDLPLIIGNSDRRIVFFDMICIQKILPGIGKPKAISDDIHYVEISADNNCAIGELGLEGNKLVENSLFTKLIALQLNFKAESDLSGLLIKEICTELDPYLVDNYLNDKSIVQDLYDLGEAALFGEYEGDYYAITNSIDAIIDHFIGCNEVLCRTPNIDPNDEYTVNPNLSGDFNLYPNPANEVVNIKLNYKSFETLTTRIYTSMGQLIYEGTANGVDNQTIDISDFTSGLYHMMIVNDDRVILTEKFLKQE